MSESRLTREGITKILEYTNNAVADVPTRVILIEILQFILELKEKKGDWD